MFEFEPKITEELKGLKNVVLAPHVGNATFETRDAIRNGGKKYFSCIKWRRSCNACQSKVFVTK